MRQLTCRPIIIGLFILAPLIAFGGFAVLGDLTQLVIQFPRSVTMAVWDYRMEIMGRGLTALIIAVLFSIRYHCLSRAVLVLFYEKTNIPIQQIYPDGKVFFNPATTLWDKMVRGMVAEVTYRQYTMDKPAFPT